MKTIARLCLIITFLVVTIPPAFAEDGGEPAPIVPITVHLTIVASSTQLFSGDVATVPCDSDGEGEAGASITGYCTVLQAPVTSAWSWWGSDVFLNSINDNANDDVNGWYWGWFNNLTYGATALNKYVPVEGDSLLLVLNSTPLRLTATSLAPEVGSEITFMAEQFGYDEFWNPVWLPATGSEVQIGADVFPVSDAATYVRPITTIDAFSAVAQKASGNFISSPPVTISPVAPAPEPEPEPSGGGSSQQPSSQSNDPTFSLSKAIDFLLGFQEGDGSFGSAMYTDWSILALKAASGNDSARNASALAKEYAADHPLKKSASLTDYERRAMALMALKINPYNGTEVNYIEKIVDEFDGTQFGDGDLVNDDIFALLVLAKAGYKSSDEIMKKDVAFVIDEQKSSGAWIGIDLTAAAVQALRPFASLDGVADALEQGEQYIASGQQADGSYGNIFTLSWAIQALSDGAGYGGALDKADDALASSQQEDGGFEAVSADPDNRLWATAYAIPAALHKSWSDLLSSFKKIEIVQEKEADDDSAASEPSAPAPEDTAAEAPAPAAVATTYTEPTPTVLAASVVEPESAPAQLVQDEEVLPAQTEISEEPLVLAASPIEVFDEPKQGVLLWGVLGFAGFGGGVALFLFLRRRGI